MTTVRELVAKFGVDFDDKGAKKASTQIDSLKGGMTGLIGLVGGAALLKSTFDFVRGQVEMGNSIKVTSERIGVTTDELQKFRFAAASNAIGTEAADGALQRFARNMGAAGKGAGPAGKAVHALGIHLKDQHGNLRPVNELLGDVADKFQAAKSPADRLRMAFDLFGRGGVAMASVLKDGRKGLEALGAEAEDLGGIISKDQVEAAHKAEIAMHRWDFAMQGLKNEIMSHLLPVLTQGIGVAERWFKKFREVEKGTHLVEAGMAVLAVTAAKLAGSMLEFLGFSSGGAGLAALGLLIAMALALDDIITFATGGKSAIGDLMDAIGGAGSQQKVLQDLRDTFNGIAAAVHDLTTDFEKFVRTMNAVPKGVFNKLFEAGANAFRGAKHTAGHGIDAPLMQGTALSRLGAGVTVDPKTGLHTTLGSGYVDVDTSADQADIPRAARHGSGKQAHHRNLNDESAGAFDRYLPTPEQEQAKKWRAQMNAGILPGHDFEGIPPVATAARASSAAAPITIDQKNDINIVVNGATDARATAQQVKALIEKHSGKMLRDGMRGAADHGEPP